MHELDDLSPNQLACRAQAGCEVSFSELAKRYRPRLIRFLEKRLGGRAAEAEDVVQEALAKAWQEIHRFDPQYQFATWLYTIATRLSIDWLKRTKPTSCLDGVEPIDAAESVDATLVRQEETANLWSTAQRVLSSSQYSALWLRYGEGLSAKEVACVLGKTTVGIRVLLHRARSTLQPHLVSYVEQPATRQPQIGEALS